MDKIKKLRLKRRLPQSNSRVTSEHFKEPNLDAAVLLSSNSDESDGGLSSKQRKRSEPCLPTEEIGFLQSKNPSLNKLREMILSLSPRDADIANLSPFPAFPTQDEDAARHQQENRVKLLQERLLPVSKLQSVEELSPFPKMCRHFKRLSDQSATNMTNTHTESADNDVEEKNHAQDKNSHRFSSTSYNNIELRNLNENDQMKEAKEDVESGSADKSKVDLRKLQSPATSELGHENCSVIRDRNSNFYALQSQNIRREPVCINRNSKSSLPKSGIDAEKSLFKKRVDVDACADSDNFIVMKQNTKSQKKMAVDIPTSSYSEEKQVVKSERTLQNCPLCQMKFDSRCDQMDIDSHIATCLSTAEDDVIW